MFDDDVLVLVLTLEKIVLSAQLSAKLMKL